MTNWERVQEVFLMTADVPAKDRPPLLESLCAQDAELRAEVESLLKSDCDSGAVIEEAVQSEASLLFESEPLPGKRAGAYRLVREIGRGGMGAVYLALRDDEAYQKEVAVKVVKPGMDTADVLNRFRYERQILAGLEHPYIARLFDGGSTDEGLPFFVMEYVEGQPVDLFCRANTLNNRARCALFLKILEAVAYAHRNLVVHRDLKPGNIFVTGDGTPKLLDFGVAKLISGNDAGQTITTLLRPFTPEYASPEQVLGLAVTTATDIYSLGAVFYELLTDRRAQPIPTPTPAEIERAVCKVDSPRPSEIAPSVDEDLDNIVLMAMRKEPERRYQSVDQFAEDIQRYLAGRPILARQDSVTYRLRKFLVRNRLQLATVSLLILGLSGGLAVSLVQTHRTREALRLAESQRLIATRESKRAELEAHRSEAALQSEARQRGIAEKQTILAEEQRDEAQRQRALAEERVTDLFELANRALFDVHDKIRELPGSMDARKQIVKSTLDYLNHLRKETGLDDRMRFALAAAYLKVSQIQGSHYFPSLQDFAGADASLRQADALISPLFARKPSDTDVSSLYLTIEIARTDNLDETAGEKAIARYLELLPIAHRQAQRKDCDLDCQKQESEIENQLSNAYQQINDPRSLEHADREIALSRKMLAKFPEDFGLKRDVAISLSSAASAEKSRGNIEKAAEDFRESIQIREALLREKPQDVETHRGLFVAYGNYAAVLGIPATPNLGRSSEALEMGAKCVALARESVAADAQDATARFDLAMALGRYGTITPAAGQIQQSLASLQEAIGLMEPAVKTNPDSSFYAMQLALLLEFQGHRYEALGKMPEAIESYRKSIQALHPFLMAKDTAAIHQEMASEEGLALALASTGDSTAATALATQVVAEAEKYNQPPPSDYHADDLARAHATLALVQEKTGNPDAARANAARALSIWRGIHNPGVLSIRSATRAETEALLGQPTAAAPSH